MEYNSEIRESLLSFFKKENKDLYKKINSKKEYFNWNTMTYDKKSNFYYIDLIDSYSNLYCSTIKFKMEKAMEGKEKVAKNTIKEVFLHDIVNAVKISHQLIEILKKKSPDDYLIITNNKSVVWGLIKYNIKGNEYVCPLFKGNDEEPFAFIKFQSKKNIPFKIIESSVIFVENK